MHIICKQLSHLMAVLLFCFSCKQPAPNSHQDTSSIPTVQIIHPRKATLKTKIHATGILETDKEVKLSFKIPGILDALNVTEGQAVTKGDTLAKLDLTEISSKRNQSEEQFLKTERDLQRVQNLYRDSVVTLEVLQNAQTSHRVSTLQLKVADFNLSKTSILAPEHGIVLSVLAEEGEMIGSGQPVVFFGAVNSTYKVTCRVIDKHIHKIQLRDSVRLTFDAINQGSIVGYIQSIGAKADPYTGTFKVEVSVSKTKLPLFSGMFASADIYTSEENLCYEIPFESIIEVVEETAKIVIIHQDGFEIKAVEILSMDENKVMVAGNISEEDQIITKGYQDIINGSAYIVQQQDI